MIRVSYICARAVQYLVGIKTFVVLGVTIFALNLHGQVAVETTPNTICTGESKKCEYSGPSILINEINISPSHQDGSLVTGSDFGTPNWGEGEWIELYNPNECNEIDISGYMLGSYNGVEGSKSAKGMGFILPKGSVVPPNGFVIVRGREAAAPPAGVIDIVALEANNNICIEGGSTSRFWFQNAGSWFAFYDRDGAVQDAIKWGNPVLSDLDKNPCIPAANVFPSSVTSVASYNQAGVGHHLGAPVVGQTYVRIPDGGSWSSSMAYEYSSYGSCNLSGSCVNGEGSSTCNGTAILNPSFGSAPYTYVWGDDLEQTTSSATKLCEGIYNVLVTDVNGTNQSVVVTVKDDFLEIDSLAIIQPNCTIDYGSIEVFLKGQAATNGSYVYNWNPVVSAANFAGDLEGGYYSITVSDVFCLRDTFAMIRDKEIEIVPVVDQPAACMEKPVNFANYSTGVKEGTSSCEWDFGDGEASSNCSPSHLYESIGTYHVTLKITDEYGCEKEVTTYSMVGVNALPVVDLGNDSSFCGNETMVLDAGLGFTDYVWSNGAGGVSTNTVFPYGEESVIVTDINGCEGMDTILLSSVPFPIFDLGDDLTFCDGGSATIDVPLSQVSYLWNTNETSSSIIISSKGFYSVQVINSLNCTSSDTMQLFVVSYPLYADISKDTIGCVGDIQTLSISTDGEQVLWNNNAFGKNAFVTETGKYGAIVSNSMNGVSCNLSDSIDVVFHSYVDLIEPDSSLYCFEFGASLLINTPTIATYYDWDVELNELFQRTTGGNEVRVYSEGIYSVAVYDNPFCQKTQDIVVQEKCPLRFYIPNAFSPNGDDINDLFIPVAPNFETLEITVFNRWGQIIFHSKDGKGWDGRVNGKRAQQDVYVWKCAATGYDEEYHKKSISKNGTVTLLR